MPKCQDCKEVVDSICENCIFCEDDCTCINCDSCGFPFDEDDLCPSNHCEDCCDGECDS